MTNIELQALLAKFPPNLEVVAFRTGNMRLAKIQEVYVGNERYLPGSTKRNEPDKVIIQYKQGN